MPRISTHFKKTVKAHTITTVWSLGDLAALNIETLRVRIILIIVILINDSFHFFHDILKLCKFKMLTLNINFSNVNLRDHG